ncbi:hypothetical protein Vretifemale_17782 [Volvox reticuliferus]|nr:hypothetical protein Vretifemale_17782 [Volvox reticuliferus]
MALCTGGASKYRRVLSTKFIESGYLCITLDRREGGGELVRACLARYGAESLCDDDNVKYSRFDVALYNIHGIKYEIALVGHAAHRRKKEWKFVRIREWLAASDIRDGTLVEFRHGPDGRIVFEVIAQTFPAGTSPGANGSGRKPYGAAEGNGGYVAALGQGLAHPLHEEITLTQSMYSSSHLCFHPLSQLAAMGLASRLSGDRKYDVLVRDEVRHGTLYECQMWPYGGDGGPGQAGSAVRWRLVGLGPFFRLHNLAPGDKVMVTLSPAEGPMLLRVARLRGFDEPDQAPKVKIEVMVAAAARSQGCKDGAGGNSSSSSSGSGSDSEHTDGTCGSGDGSSSTDTVDDDADGSEEDDDDDDDYDYRSAGRNPPSQPTPATGTKRGRHAKATAAGAPGRGRSGSAAAAVPPEATAQPPKKRRRIESSAMAEGLFDPCCGKALTDSDFYAVNVSRAMCSPQGVFKALMGREMPVQLTLRAEAGAEEFSWKVWIRACSSKSPNQLRLTSMGAVMNHFGLVSGDVILCAATDDPLTYIVTCWRVSSLAAADGGASGPKLEQLWPSSQPDRRAGRVSGAAAATAMAAAGIGSAAAADRRCATARCESTSDKEDNIPLATRMALARAPEPDGGGDGDGRRRARSSSVGNAGLSLPHAKGGVTSEHALAAATRDVRPAAAPPSLDTGPAIADPKTLRSQPPSLPALLPAPCGVQVKDEPGVGEGVAGAVHVGPVLGGDGTGAAAADHKPPLTARNARGCGSGWRPMNLCTVEGPVSTAREEEPPSSTIAVLTTPTTEEPEARPGSFPVALPASSITHPHGYVPDGPPALRPGELRICGLTFHPELRDLVERLQAVWVQGLKDPLARTDPIRHQMAILGVDIPTEAPGGSPHAGAAAAAAANDAAFTFRRHGLKRNVICNRLARMLGLMGEGCVSDSKLPEACPPWIADVRCCEDLERGGFGLEAANTLQANVVLGVMGGYVLPNVARVELMNYGACNPRVTEEMRRRAGEASVTAWQFLTDAFMLPYTWPSDVQPDLRHHHQQQQQQMSTAVAATSVGAAPAPQWQAWAAAAQGLPAASISMLGYGNLAALVNDPRVEPREWLPDNDLDSTAIADKANCMVLPVAVRGLVLPVMVTLRPISKGEQLLYDYGSQWWRRLMDAWEMLDAECLTPAQALWGLVPAEGSGKSDVPISAVAVSVPAELEAVEAAFDAAADMVGNAVPSVMSTDGAVIIPEPPAASPMVSPSALPSPHLNVSAERHGVAHADGSRQHRHSVPDGGSGGGGGGCSSRSADAAAMTAAAVPAATERCSRPPPLAVPLSESFFHGDSADRAIPRDRSQDRGQDRHRDRGLDRHRDRDLDRHRDRGLDRHRDRDLDRHRDRDLDRYRDPDLDHYRDPDLDPYRRKDHESGPRLLNREGREIRSRDDHWEFRSRSREREVRDDQLWNQRQRDDLLLRGPDNRGRRHGIDRETYEQEGWHHETERRLGDRDSRQRDDYSPRKQPGQDCSREGPFPNWERSFSERPLLDDRYYDHHRGVAAERQRRLEYGLRREPNNDVGQRRPSPPGCWVSELEYDDRYVPLWDQIGRGRDWSLRGGPPAPLPTEQYLDIGRSGGGVRGRTVGCGNTTDGGHQKGPQTQSQSQPQPQPQSEPSTKCMGDALFLGVTSGPWNGASDEAGKGGCRDGASKGAYGRVGKGGACVTGGGDGTVAVGGLPQLEAKPSSTKDGAAVAGCPLKKQMTGRDGSDHGSDDLRGVLIQTPPEDGEVAGGCGGLPLDTQWSATRCDISADEASLAVARVENVTLATAVWPTEGQHGGGGQLPPRLPSYGAPAHRPGVRVSNDTNPSDGQVRDAVICSCTAADAAGAGNGASATANATASEERDVELEAAVMVARTRWAGMTWRALVPYSTISHDEPSGSPVATSWV